MRPRGPVVGTLHGLLAGLLIATCLVHAASASETIVRKPAEPWVEILDLPVADPAYADSIRDGISHLLSEFQVRPAEGGREAYDRRAYQVVDRTGLDDGARISFEFNPKTETVTINRLQIVRDGKILDRLDSARIEIARRESDAERGIFDGRLTAYINLDDVRVGDIVDSARTIVRRPVIGGNLFYLSNTVEWTVPVARQRMKIVWPTGAPLHFKSHGIDFAPRIETVGGATSYLWERLNPKPVKTEPNTPPDVPDRGYVEISSTDSWQDVVAATLPHYRLDKELPAEFVERLDAISSKFPKLEDRLVQAMRLVQDEIRYVSLSIGTGSHIPRLPAEVVISGFGDCKDKSLLLATALARLGIAADVALTDLDHGYALHDRLPGIPLFDHMIVRATIGRAVYWIDPTNYLQGGMASDLATPDYGYALPITPTSSRLEPIPVKPLIKPTQSITETFAFPEKAGAPLTLGVETTYFGAAADTMRYRLKRESVAKIADDYVRYYNGQYPGMRSVAQLRTKDDRDANVVVVTEQYELSADDLAVDDLAKDFPLKGDFGLSDLPTPSKVDRKAPVWIGRPILKQHKSIVRNLKARFAPPPDSAIVAAPFAALSTITSATETTFEVTWNFVTLTDRIPASYLGKYLKSLDDMTANAKWTFDFTYVTPKTE